MAKSSDVSEFDCSKCDIHFLGLPSFHGEYRIPHSGGVREVNLCSKCLAETDALWSGETKTIVRQIEEKIDYLSRQHAIDRNAEKRIAYVDVLDFLVTRCTIFDGYNVKSGYGRDLSQLELHARKMIHGDFRINFDEQVQLSRRYPRYRYVADGLMKIGKREVVLEFDSEYRHGSDDQQERDYFRDLHLREDGYQVVRIPEQVIKNDRSGLKNLLLDVIYNVKRGSKKRVVSTQPTVSPTSNYISSYYKF